ncbi:NUDIX domain-containing protein [Candidatus Shapirobacteria bacterium]|nr:NUDIX domain-containing protein [Candidatus Shapirobacteria bacterium]
MKIVRTRVSALIIKDKKILLVKGNEGFYKEFYFTPGGKVETGEDDLMAMNRELGEEMSISPTTIEKYFSYEARIGEGEQYQRVNCYLVKEFSGVIVLGAEIGEMLWYSKDDYTNNQIGVSESMYQNLFPKLIKDELI